MQKVVVKSAPEGRSARVRAETFRCSLPARFVYLCVNQEWYYWWLKSYTSWYGKISHYLQGFSTIPGGAGFQPSTVSVHIYVKCQSIDSYWKVKPNIPNFWKMHGSKPPPLGPYLQSLSLPGSVVMWIIKWIPASCKHMFPLLLVIVLQQIPVWWMYKNICYMICMLCENNKTYIIICV